MNRLGDSEESGDLVLGNASAINLGGMSPLQAGTGNGGRSLQGGGSVRITRDRGRALLAQAGVAAVLRPAPGPGYRPPYSSRSTTQY